MQIPIASNPTMANNYFTIDKIFSTVNWKGSTICRNLGLFISTPGSSARQQT